MTANDLALPFGTFELPFPWCTPAVDALICALDARNVGIPEILRRVKRQFPSLANVAIPLVAVEKRILILDQIVEIDYFKAGLGLGGRDVEAGVGESGGVKHGLLIYGNHGEDWEEKGLTIIKPARKTISLDSFHPIQDSPNPRRAVRHGLAIHAQHDEQWEVLSKMRALGRERSSSGKKTSSEATTTLIDSAFPLNLPSIPRGSYDSDTTVPRPLSPARGDENGRPKGVEQSLMRLSSFKAKSTSKTGADVGIKKAGHIPIATAMTTLKTPPNDPNAHMPHCISIFPKVPEHQRPKAVVGKLSLQEMQSGRLGAPRSSISIGKFTKGKVLQKKAFRDGGYLTRPIIHITKPSQEQAEVGEDSR